MGLRALSVQKGLSQIASFVIIFSGSRTKCEYHPMWCYGERINSKDILDSSTVITENKAELGNNVHNLHVNGVGQYVSKIIPSAAIWA